MSATNDDIMRMLAEHRDAMMHRLGVIEGTQKTLANGVAEASARADRAEKVALEAKRRASDSVHEMSSTFSAIAKHVEESAKPINLAISELKAQSARESDGTKRTVKKTAAMTQGIIAAIVALAPLLKYLYDLLTQIPQLPK